MLMATADISSKPINLNQMQAEIAPQTPLQRTIRRFRKHRAALFGLVIVLGVILYVVIGSIIFTEAYANHNDLTQRLQPPSREHPFGTDRIGRDIMARTIYGGQISLIIGLLAGGVEVTLGVAVGAVAAFYGGWV